MGASDGPPFRDQDLADDLLGAERVADRAELQWDWAESVQQWDRYLAMASPKMRPRAIRRKAECLVRIGQMETAARLLGTIREHIEGIEGLAQLTFLREPPHVVGQLWDECAARFPDHVSGFLGKAHLLFDREAYAEVDPLLEYLVAAWPKSAAAAVLWSQCATAAKKWQLAEERWRKVLTRFEADQEIIRGYARYVAAAGDPAAAQGVLDQFRHDPLRSAEFRCEYYLAADDFGAAMEHSAQLVELEPEKPSRGLRHAILLMREGSAQALHRAVSILRELLKRSPETTELKCQLAEALIRLRGNEEAANLIRTISEEDKHADVEVLRAWARHRAGDDGAARKHWANVLERRYVPAVHAPIRNLVRLDGGDVNVLPNDIVLFSAMRNERQRLEWFFDYYRELGVTKFVIVDNGSDDGGVEFLLNSRDIILYRSDEPYSRSGSGMRWINELVERHGRQNWCLHVDADEALVFSCEANVGLRGLTEYLNKEGYECMVARLIDLYPQQPPRGGPAGDTRQAQSLYKYFDNHFDTYGSPICPYQEAYGGVRRRLLRGYQMLQKVPLINGAAGIKFLLSSHRVTPARVADVTGALLHYHLVYHLQPEYQPLLAEAIERREFPSNSLERLRSRELLQKLGSRASFLCQRTVKFESAAQLSSMGLIEGRKRLGEGRGNGRSGA